MTLIEIKPDDVVATYRVLQKETNDSGYRLNPDVEFTKNLIVGLLKNERRYGYRACPCRLASGKMETDRDIICPCDYRDPDLNDFSACYCALYVSDDIASGRKVVAPVPERRPPRSERGSQTVKQTFSLSTSPVASLAFPVWRCKVCGYLCARDQPPEICPICKVTKDRFERFM